MPVKWNEGKLNNYRKQEQCAVLFHNGIGDTSCENYFPYICYRKASVGDELTACGTVDKEYNLDARTGQCYKLHDQAETWQRAHMICQAEGAYLAIINSEAESEVLKELTLENPWPPGQPNNATHPTKHFTSQTSGSVGTDGKLSDMWCEEPSAFI
ncbi:C-type lectin, partial [Operophtera brumata]